MAKEETGNGKDEQSMREDWLSDLAPLSDSAQQFSSGEDIPISEEETADLLDEVEFRFSGNQSIDDPEDPLLMEALVLGSPVDGEQDKDAPKLSEEKMQILLGEVRKQLSTPSVESTSRKTRKIIPFKPILSALGVAAAVILGFFIFKGDPSVDPGAVAQNEIEVMPQGGAIVLAFNGEAQVSEREGDEKSDFRTLVDGDLLAPGMELKTGAEGEAVLLLTNGSLATLGPSSQMRLSEFAQMAFEGTEERVSDLAEEPSESHVLLELDLGELVVEVKKLDKQSSFDLYSPLGFAGIRGTQYRVLATDRSVRLSVLEGKVAVSKERGGLDHLIESERAILLEEDLQKEPDGATVEEIERIKRVNERARKLAEKIKLKDLADAYDEINKRLAYALKEKELEQAMNKAIDEGTYIVESAANMEMIWCKPGTFMMGSPETEKGRAKDETQHKVTLTQGFFLGKYEVTQEEYQMITGKNPSAFRGKNLPIETATWKEAKEFCDKLTEQENKSGRLSESWIYTLPSEAQWEYACRAGTTSAYSWGNQINPKLANFNNSKIGKTIEVGSYKANPWGFYDMTGNVWEWCYDWWQKSISREDQIDPFGPQSGFYRAKRGGSWVGLGSYLRSADRDNGSHKSNRNVGFRLCLRQITDFDELANLSSKVEDIPGLVRHWKFDNEEANVSKSSVGGFDANLMGGAKLVLGKIGNAVELDGDSAYVDFGMGAGDTDGNFTVSFFAKYLGKDPPEQYSRLMTNKKSHNSEDGWHFHLMSKREKWGAGSMWVRGSSEKGFGKKVNDDWKAGNWHHIVASFEGENVTIYSDGKNRGNGKVTPVMNGLKNFTFSTKMKGFGFHGQLDDLRIYDRILTESEIMDIYEMGEFVSKLGILETKDDPKIGLALVEEEFEEAMKKPVGEGIHIVESANNMEMIWCKPGSFIMGSPETEEGRNNGAPEDQYEVTLTKGFFLGKYEVTQFEWEKIMGNNPSTFKGDQRPAETVSWLQEIEFCKKLTDLERKANRLSEDWYFTLPTEAEWEYACRAGTTSIFSWGNNVSSDQANFDASKAYGAMKPDSSLGTTTDVGSYLPNPWGFYDMHGNVGEKVYDWKGKYPEKKSVDPLGPTKGRFRLSRGGSYMSRADTMRSARRGNGGTPGYKGKHVGFRLCLKQIKEEGKQASIPDKVNLKEGLVGWWKFDETKGKIAKDSSGKNRDGELKNFDSDTIQWVKGPVGNAISLDGKNDYIDVGDFEWGGELSFSAWIYYRSYQPWPRVLDFGDGPKSNVIFVSDGYRVRENKFVVSIMGFGGTSVPKLFKRNQWYHMAFTISPDSELNLFAGGEKVGSDKLTGIPPKITRKLQYFGKSQHKIDAHLNGILDDLRIYDRTINESEIKALFALGDPPELDEVLINGGDSIRKELKPMDESKGAKLTESKNEAQEKTEPFRKFTSVQGTPFTGRVLSYEGQTFFLEGKDKKIISVPLKSLSDDDQKYLIKTVQSGKISKGDPAKKSSLPIEGKLFTVSSNGMELIWCKPGNFTMGCPSSEDSGRITENTPQHKVTITKGFYLGKYEVTQDQWMAVMGTNPSRVKGGNLPVEKVHWYDAMKFCSKLTEIEQSASRLENGWEYTLPTEAEWEYACRAGTTTAFSWGNDINSSMALYNRKAQAKPVGSYPSNNWGFYDMHGNIYEWCSDWLSEYSPGPRIDPVGPTSGDRKVLRGGGFFNPWFKLRSASRGSDAPTDRSTSGSTGFRVAYKKIEK